MRLCTALLAAVAGCASAAEPVAPPAEAPPAGSATRQDERQQVGERQVPVSAKAELTIRGRSDADVKTKELWYRTLDQGRFGAWQKHGLSFNRETPITWAPTEAHWQILLRYQEISGQWGSEPSTDTAGLSEFIIDRTAPTVAISFPADGAKLRGGQRYTVAWEASDPHLHSQGITIKWARDNGSAATAIAGAELLANSGSYEWTTPQDMTNAGVLIVEATDRAGNVGRAQVGNLVVDAIAPSRNILGPAIVAARDVDLAIRCQDAGPAGLASVQLFYSADQGATWNAGPTITEGFESLPWTAPADGRYQLILVASDAAGNANPRPTGQTAGASELLVDTEVPALTLVSPVGLSDPTVAATAPQRRVFKPGDTVEVRFTVKDANTHPTGITVLLQTEEGGRYQAIGESLAPDRAFSFTIPDLATASARIRVEAVDLSGNRGTVDAAETFRVDNKVEQGTVEVDL